MIVRKPSRPLSHVCEKTAHTQVMFVANDITLYRSLSDWLGCEPAVGRGLSLRVRPQDGGGLCLSCPAAAER